MKTIAFANKKGGVGKTSLGVHFAFRFAEQGYKVLFVDTDPQGNASSTLRDHDTGLLASRLFLKDFELPAIAPSAEGIALIRGDSSLQNLDREPVQIIQYLMTNLSRLSEEFDVCVIDTSPNIGMRTKAALFVSDYILSPIQVEQYSIEGIRTLLEDIFEIRAFKEKHEVGSLTFLGMLPNQVNNTSPMHLENLKAIVKHFPQFMIPLKLSQRTSVGEALAGREPVWKLRKSAAREAAKEFKKVISEVQKRMGLKEKV